MEFNQTNNNQGDVNNALSTRKESGIPIVFPVPALCPICLAQWRGGCEIPGKPFPKVGLRAFYGCGCQVSVAEDRSELMEDGAYYAYLLSVKGCCKHLEKP